MKVEKVEKLKYSMRIRLLHVTTVRMRIMRMFVAMVMWMVICVMIWTMECYLSRLMTDVKIAPTFLRMMAYAAMARALEQLTVIFQTMVGRLGAGGSGPTSYMMGPFPGLRLVSRVTLENTW